MCNLQTALIISGTAKIAPDIISLLSKHFKIDATYRDINKTYNVDNVSWIKLDIDDYNSIQTFVNDISEKYYSMVLILSMTTPGDFLENTEKELRDFYGNYLVNNMLLGKNLLTKITDSGKIIYMSSIAGNKPTPAINYSTLKGALQSFYVSLSTQAKPLQSIFCIVPGLIYDSPAFYRHDPIMYNNDINMLTTKEEIAKLILNCDQGYNGKMIRLGKDQ